MHPTKQPISQTIATFNPRTYCSVYISNNESCVLTVIKVLGQGYDGRIISSSFKVHDLTISHRIARDYVADVILQHMNELMQARVEAARMQREIYGIYLNRDWYKQPIQKGLSERRKNLPYATQPAFTLKGHYFKSHELDKKMIELGQLRFLERLENGQFQGIERDILNSLKDYNFDQTKGLSNLPVVLGAVSLLMKNVGSDTPTAAQAYLRGSYI